MFGSCCGTEDDAVVPKKKVVMLQSKTKLGRTDDDIHDAVKAWSASKHAAEEKYGPMPEWDTSKETDPWSS